MHNFLESDFSFEQYLEARRNPELNPKISAYEALLPYKDDPDIYISFTKVDKIGINPQSSFNTPLGIYTYPLKEVWKEYEFDKTKSPGKSVPFAGGNPFIWILRRKKGVKFIEDLYNTYTSKEYDEDYKELDYYFAANRPGLNLRNIEETARKQARHQSPSGIMWNLTRLLAEHLESGNKKAMVQWNTILYRILGYHGIADKSGRGIIHTAEPIQAVFLTTRGFDVVGQIYNKDYVGVGVDQNKYKFVTWLKNLSKYGMSPSSFSNEVKEIIISTIYPSIRNKYHFWGDRVFPIDDDYVKRIINMLIYEDESKGKISPYLSNQLLGNIEDIVEKFARAVEIEFPDKDEIYNLLEQWAGESRGIIGPYRLLRDRIIPKITIIPKEGLYNLFRAYIDFVYYHYSDLSNYLNDENLPVLNKKQSSIFIDWIVDVYNL